MLRSRKLAPAALLPLVLLAAALVGGCSVEPQNVEISVEAPVSAQPGESFLIRAVATNTAQKSQKLVALDIADEYLEGIAIERSEPPFKEAFHVPIDNSMSYVFDLPLKPGESREVIFHAYAAHAGDHSGDVDFCINTEFTFVSYPVRTIVQ